MKRRFASCFLFLLSLGWCQITEKEPGAPAPKVDHHQHLLSPASAALVNAPQIPRLKLPKEIAHLLDERAARWNDKSGLAQLYTEKAVAFNADTAGLLDGREAIAEYMSRRFARAFRLTPAGFATRGSTAHVSGYFTRAEGDAVRPFGYFYLGLEKGSDGRWRITREIPTFPGPTLEEPVSADALVHLLDEAGIRRAVVLSTAYFFDGRIRSALPDAHAKVRAENDWTAQQVAKFPKRLVAFCSFNPLSNYSLTELERCAESGRFRGVKLHFGVSQVDLKNSEHVEKVRSVFAAANRRRLALVVHVRADRTYGREHAQIFLEQLLPAAPDVTVQIAHLWGGEGFSQSALAAYAEGVASGGPRTKNLYFDVAEVALVAGGSEEALQECARRMRQIGLNRILYGSDAPGFGNVAPRQAWADFRARLGLTEQELGVIAENTAPYIQNGSE
jgi:predicted TIM-barrel fold metal-dependent hydrolase